MLRFSLLASTTLACALVLASCSSSSGTSNPAPLPVPTNANPNESPPSKDKPKDPTTQLIVGLDAEDFRSRGYGLTDVTIVAKVDGLVAAQKTLAAEAGPMFPSEVRLVAPAAKPDALVEVTINARMNDAVVVARTATTHFVPGATKLLYVFLEVRCNTFQLLGGGDPSGPTCTTPGETCIGAKCRSDVVNDLPDYTTGWATSPPSRCGTGAADLALGKGELDFTTLTDGETLTTECGPQGGHHLWLSLHMKNLSQMGTITTLSATQPGSSVAVVPTGYPYAWSATDGTACELVGLRFQLDAGGTPIASFLGKPLDITVNAKDKAGHDVTVVRHVNVAPTSTGNFCR
jgi:hypothetical protein